jgi:RNA polymerase sigma-70 factor (ECF subfamily)
LARSYAVNDADGDDLFQEIMLAIWRALPRFRGECTLRTFVFRIGHNRALTFVKRRRRHEPIDRAVDLADARPGPAENAERAERQERLLAAVRQLPELQRQVVILSFEGLSQREIAEVLGSTENSIAVRLSRARATLRLMFSQKAEL